MVPFSTRKDGERGRAVRLSPMKPWTITSREPVRNKLEVFRANRQPIEAGGTASIIMLATPKWMGLFSFTRAIYRK